MAENEDESQWGPLHVERGFKRGDSTVTVIGGPAPQNIFTSGLHWHKKAATGALISLSLE